MSWTRCNPFSLDERRNILLCGLPTARYLRSEPKCQGFWRGLAVLVQPFGVAFLHPSTEFAEASTVFCRRFSLEPRTVSVCPTCGWLIFYHLHNLQGFRKMRKKNQQVQITNLIEKHLFLFCYTSSPWGWLEFLQFFIPCILKILGSLSCSLFCNVFFLIPPSLRFGKFPKMKWSTSVLQKRIL